MVNLGWGLGEVQVTPTDAPVKPAVVEPEVPPPEEEPTLVQQEPTDPPDRPGGDPG